MLPRPSKIAGFTLTELIVSMALFGTLMAFVFGHIVSNYQAKRQEEEVESYYENVIEALERLRQDGRIASRATLSTLGSIRTLQFGLRSFDGTIATDYSITYRLLSDTCWIKGIQYSCQMLERTDSRNPSNPVFYTKLLNIRWCLWSNPLDAACPVGIALPSGTPETGKALLVSMEYLPLFGSRDLGSTISLVADLGNSLSSLRDPNLKLVRRTGP